MGNMITVRVKNVLGTEEVDVYIGEDETVDQLLQKSAPQLQINPRGATILFQGQILPLEKLLNETGIRDGDAVMIAPGSIVGNMITVRVKNVLGTEEVDVYIGEDETVDQLLQKSAPQLQINPRGAIVMYQGQQLRLQHSLNRVGIRDLDAVMIAPGSIVGNMITVRVKNVLGTEEVDIHIAADETVDQLLKEAAPQLQINPRGAIVIYQGQQLPLEKLLNETGIRDGDAVMIAPGSIVGNMITVRVKNVLGTEEVDVYIGEDETVDQLLQKSAPQLQINPRGAIVMYQGQILPLEKLLIIAGIRDGDAVMIAPGSIVGNMITVRVKNVLGAEEVDIHIAADETVDQLLQKSAPQLQINPRWATILYKGQQLHPELPLNETGIRDGDAVMIVPESIYSR